MAIHARSLRIPGPRSSGPRRGRIAVCGRHLARSSRASSCPVLGPMIGNLGGGSLCPVSVVVSRGDDGNRRSLLRRLGRKPAGVAAAEQQPHRRYGSRPAPGASTNAKDHSKPLRQVVSIESILTIASAGPISELTQNAISLRASLPPAAMVGEDHRKRGGWWQLQLHRAQHQSAAAVLLPSTKKPPAPGSRQVVEMRFGPFISRRQRAGAVLAEQPFAADVDAFARRLRHRLLSLRRGDIHRLFRAVTLSWRGLVAAPL